MMKKYAALEKRKTFRHGDLRNALVTAGLEMARVEDPMRSFCGRQHARQVSPRMRLTDISLVRLNCWMRYDRHACLGSRRRSKAR